MTPKVEKKVVDDFIKNVLGQKMPLEVYKEYFLELAEKQPLLGIWFTEWTLQYLKNMPIEVRYAALQAFVIPLKLIYMQDELNDFNKMMGKK